MYATARGNPAETGDVRPEPLRELLTCLAGIDRLQARAIELTTRLHASGECEDATGLPVEVWLAVEGRMAPGDRRTLQAIADVLATMPAVAQAVASRQLSWSQTRIVALACRPLSHAERARVDEPIAGAAVTYADAEPEQLLSRVDQLVATLRHSAEQSREVRDVAERFLALQPRVDGTGGRLWGELDALGFAVVDQALTVRMGRPDGLEPSEGDDARCRNARRIGQRRADALCELAAESLGGRGQASRGEDGVDTATAARPLVIVTAELDALLDREQVPATLLTSLSGGVMRVTADSARRLADAGCSLRLIVTDRGRTVGVGRRARHAPGWLRDASLAMHPICLHPTCTTSARVSDADHHLDWDLDGPTDAGNIGPLCRRHHGLKTAGRTTISTADEDGVRRWRHPPSGMVVALPPTTQRLVPTQPTAPRLDARGSPTPP